MVDKSQGVSERKYAAPKLVVYGAVATLTAAGSTGAAEGVSSSSNKKA